MINVKKTLKDAREAINNKDYQTTLKLCKVILKEEKDNYMALVFMGISLQEIGSEDQALLAFKKAILLNATNVLAWNGLANYYEKKCTSEARNELFQIYITLLELESNMKKVMHYIEKIIDLGEIIDRWKFVSVVRVVIEKEEMKNIRNSVLFTVNNFLVSFEDLDKDLLEMHAEILENLVKNSNTVSSKHYHNYLKVLYKLENYEKLLESAEEMKKIYESDISPLEWICKVYVTLYFNGNCLEKLFYEKAKDASATLLKENSDSLMGLLTKSVFLYENNSPFEAKKLLMQVINVRQEHLYSWLLLSMCENRLSLYEEALISLKRANKLYESTNSSNHGIKNRIFTLLPELLSKSKQSSNWEKAIEICLKVEKIEESNDLLVPLIRSYIHLKNMKESEKWLSILRCRGKDLNCLLLEMHLLKARGNLKEALALLVENVLEDAELWLEIGLLYWQLELFEKSLIPFLKATKLDPNSYLCFQRLGQYYHKFNDLDKARRCYEKAFKLNNKCLDIGLELSKIYMKQRKWDANIIMLENLTDGKATTDNSWALIQLGLSYYDQGDYNKAIDSFRLVIRIDTNNSFCWESLGDAYLERGSYTSSLKSYQKAVELNSKSLYARLQIAGAKQILGHLAEAKCDFEGIIKENRDCVPALQGLAITCLNQAKEYKKSQLWGLARDCAQCAVDTLTKGIEYCNNAPSFWKLAGDTCYLVANLPERYCCLSILSALADGKDIAGSKIVEQYDLFILAERCYCKTMSLMDPNTSIWYDLARCYFLHARNVSNESSVNLYQKAFAAAHHCVTNNITNWEYWNLLGVIAFFKEPKNFAIAQHAFVKAVSIEKNSAVAWCNLGVLYLYVQNDKLANKAFTQAQKINPNYVNCWIGQAFIAENLKPDDAMDLFRHSTQLNFHPQSAIGYGYWVCKTILEAVPHSHIYSIHNMHAIPVACDALTWYTEKYPDDPCAWNMLGLLKERMGLKIGAVQAFRSALRLTDSLTCDKVFINYGRSLIGIGKYSQAVDMFQNVKQATFSSGSGLALALFKDKQYEESYSSYESTLHWLTEDQGYQSELLVALASMAYLFQGSEEAKTLLFQSFQLNSPSPWGLYGTLSLGLLHQDLELPNLVLKELQKIKDEIRCLPHYSVLVSYVYLLQGDSESAVREVSKLIHRHPSQASLWLSLSTLLIRLHAERPRNYAAARCGEIAMKLGQSNMDVTKVLCVVSLGLFLVNDYEQALKAAQKAIHYYPNVAECWIVFISALIIKLQSNKISPFKAKLPEKISHVRDNLKVSGSLKEWLQNLEKNF